MSITFRKATIGGLALVGTSALLLAGCAAAPAAPTTTAKASNFIPCMVSDLGGFDDKSFNQLGCDGINKAAE